MGPILDPMLTFARSAGIRLLPVLLALLVTGCLMSRPRASIPAPAFQGRTRVACVGDSITAGSGLADPGNAAYPAVLGKLLGSAYEVRNFGVSGATLLKDGDLAYARTPEYQEALEFLPEVVVIALGTNDSKPQNWRFRNTFERDAYAMVRSFLTLPSRPIVYVCAPPPVFQSRWGITADIVGREIVPRLRRMCALEGWPLIDLQVAFRGSAESFPDGIHPNAVGAAQLASSVEAAFRGR